MSNSSLGISRLGSVHSLVDAIFKKEVPGKKVMLFRTIILLSCIAAAAEEDMIFYIFFKIYQTMAHQNSGFHAALNIALKFWLTHGSQICLYVFLVV